MSSILFSNLVNPHVACHPPAKIRTPAMARTFTEQSQQPINNLKRIRLLSQPPLTLATQCSDQPVTFELHIRSLDSFIPLLI
jgi:hypothetical protein